MGKTFEQQVMEELELQDVEAKEQFLSEEDLDYFSLCTEEF